MTIFRAIVALVVLLAAPASARAQAPKAPPRAAAALTYTHPVGCKDEAALRRMVAEQIGYDPFTPGAARKIDVTITRDPAGVAALWEDRDGDNLWTRPPIVKPDCGELLRQTAVWIAYRIAPLRPREAPAVAPEPTAPPAPPSPSPPAPPVEAVQAAPTPAPPKPGAFEGRAGGWRVAAFAVSGALVATGAGFAAAAQVKAGAIRQLDGTLGSAACRGSMAGSCGQLSSLLRQHDLDLNSGIGFLVAGGVTAVAAGASIWIVRTPAHAVEVTPALPGALAAVALKGSW